MSSLPAHLARHDLAVSPLAFRRDCPLCRAERVHGRLPSAALLPSRACAAMAAALLATSAVAPSVVAAADGEGLAVPAPASPPPPEVSDVAVEGGVAPARGDPGAEQPPADAGGQGSDGDSRAGERAHETDARTGADTSSGGAGSDLDAAAQPGAGGSDADGAATVEPAPIVEPARDGARAEPPRAPGRPAKAPRTAAPVPAQGDGTRAPAQPDVSRAGLSPAKPYGEQAGAADSSGDSGEHEASRSRPGRSSASGGTARAQGGGPGGARDGDGSSDRAARTARGGHPLAAELPDTGSDTAAAPRTEREERESPATYHVRAGNSLWRIAEQRLGPHATATATAQEVTRLWELNRQRIGTGNPDLIFPGQTLRM